MTDSTLDAAARPNAMSWDRRRKLGLLKAWWLTTTGLMFRPSASLSAAVLVVGTTAMRAYSELTGT